MFRFAALAVSATVSARPENAAEIRRRHLPAHLAFLARHAANIRFAGRLRDEAAGQSAGGLWLVDADSVDAVAALTQEDPFRSAGLRRSIRVLAWQQVFADGRRTT